MTALAACPFCGGSATYFLRPSATGVVTVDCQTCGARGGEVALDTNATDRESAKARAAVLWNSRTAPAPAPYVQDGEYTVARKEMKQRYDLNRVPE